MPANLTQLVENQTCDGGTKMDARDQREEFSPGDFIGEILVLVVKQQRVMGVWRVFFFFFFVWERKNAASLNPAKNQGVSMALTGVWPQSA